MLLKNSLAIDSTKSEASKGRVQEMARDTLARLETIFGGEKPERSRLIHTLA